MSTNNRWQKLAVKSDPRKTKPELKSKILAGAGNRIAAYAAQQGSGRGRHQVESKGKVVSGRLPAEAQERARHG